LCLTLLWNYLEREGFTVASAHDVVLAQLVDMAAPTDG